MEDTPRRIRRKRSLPESSCSARHLGPEMVAPQTPMVNHTQLRKWSQTSHSQTHPQAQIRQCRQLGNLLRRGRQTDPSLRRSTSRGRRPRRSSNGRRRAARDWRASGRSIRRQDGPPAPAYRSTYGGLAQTRAFVRRETCGSPKAQNPQMHTTRPHETPNAIQQTCHAPSSWIALCRPPRIASIPATPWNARARPER